MDATLSTVCCLYYSQHTQVLLPETPMSLLCHGNKLKSSGAYISIWEQVAHCQKCKLGFSVHILINNSNICLQVFDFELKPEDMKTLESLDKNLHYGPFKEMKQHPEYPFDDEY